MNILLFRRNNSLVPHGDDAYDTLKSLPQGVILSAKITRVRCYEHHKAYFAMIHQAWEMLNEREEREFGNEENFRKYLQMTAGYFDIFCANGVFYKVHKSIAFDSLGEDEFNELHQRVLDVIFQQFIDRMSQDDILRFNDYTKWKEQN